MVTYNELEQIESEREERLKQQFWAACENCGCELSKEEACQGWCEDCNLPEKCALI